MSETVNEMLIVDIEGFKRLGKVQGATGSRDTVFKCVVCEHLQSQQSFMDNFDMTEEEASGYAHFSCEGRWFKKGKKSKKWGCDWTLGGLFRIHKMEIDFKNGKEPSPCFEIATLKEARKHRKELLEKAIKKGTNK